MDEKDFGRASMHGGFRCLTLSGSMATNQMMIPTRTHKKPVIVTIILIHVDITLRLFTCFKDQYHAQQGNESP
jgi:hypothetical protein